MQNHDTQERFERDHPVTPIKSWFKPHAYAFILLRAQSGLPCVFYGDLYGIQGDSPKPPSCSGQLPKLVLVRRLYAYGQMRDYLDDSSCVGFSRFGHPSRCGGAGLAVIMSNAPYPQSKRMYVGEQHAGEEWTDILRLTQGRVVIDERGRAKFPVQARSVGVWASSIALRREELDNLDL